VTLPHPLQVLPAQGAVAVTLSGRRGQGAARGERVPAARPAPRAPAVLVHGAVPLPSPCPSLPPPPSPSLPVPPAVSSPHCSARALPIDQPPPCAAARRLLSSASLAAKALQSRVGARAERGLRAPEERTPPRDRRQRRIPAARSPLTSGPPDLSCLVRIALG
jgi:hypothetical protein